MEKPGDSPASSEPTRRKLIAAGFVLFGGEGYAAASTRRIAELAGVNIATIAYHFGGKGGLYEACAQTAAERVAEAVGQPQMPGTVSPGEARNQLAAMLRNLAGFLLTAEEARSIVGFVVREMSASEATVQLLFDSFIGPKHREICALWAAATGRDAQSEEVRLAVFAMIGQVLYFRIGQPIVLRAMGWEQVGPDEADRITEILVAQLDAALDRSRT